MKAFFKDDKLVINSIDFNERTLVSNFIKKSQGATADVQPLYDINDDIAGMRISLLEPTIPEVTLPEFNTSYEASASDTVTIDLRQLEDDVKIYVSIYSKSGNLLVQENNQIISISYQGEELLQDITDTVSLIFTQPEHLSVQKDITVKFTKED